MKLKKKIKNLENNIYAHYQAQYGIEYLRDVEYNLYTKELSKKWRNFPFEIVNDELMHAANRLYKRIEKMEKKLHKLKEPLTIQEDGKENIL